MRNIEKQIEKNLKLLQEIEEIAKKITIGSEKRDLLFSGFFRNTLSHYYSIIILCDKKLYNSAFSLIRVFFESAIRADYLHIKLPDEKINNLYGGVGWNRAFPTVGEICEEIDAEYDSDFYTKIKNIAYNPMNDYTHTGYQQISRNFDGEGTVKASFSEDLIIDSLHSIFSNQRISGFLLEQGEVIESHTP
jgi:acyl carrier protein